MKNIMTSAKLVLIIAAVCGSAPASPGGDDLIKMARSGVDEEVLKSYIQSSTDTFDLGADDIITLKDLGVSSDVISEALRHSNEIDSASARETIKEAVNDTGETSPVLSSAAAAPPGDNLNISFFYESLYPYGNWLMIDGDWCWQPNATVINGDWAPYCDRGRWVYSDWGWCWVSDYSWGWAPFHYGRWFQRPHYGWYWVPDTDWGPAWVAWRSGNGYCGWAPLPPHSRYVQNHGFYFGASLVGGDFEFNLTLRDYHFLPYDRLGDSHPWRHMLSSQHAEDAYGKTSFVKNGYGFDHGHIFNHGLPVDEVSRAGKRNIPAITIVHDNLNPGQPIQRGMVRQNRLVIYKPAISPAVPETPAAIMARFGKKPADRQTGNFGKNQNEALRRDNAVRSTIKNERLAAQAAQRARADLEKTARSEADMKKRAELHNEASMREMQAQRANDHIARIEQLKKSETPVPMPHSRIIPQPATDNQELIRQQLQSQVRDEARIERQMRRSRDEWGGRVTSETPPPHREPPTGQGSAGNRGRQKDSKRDR
jgi:hypothetical protein